MSSSKTQIPGDAPDRAKFLYHAKHEGARRVDLKDKDIAESEIRRLMSEGWAEKRTAVMLYHEKLAPEGKVFRSDAEIAVAKKNDWQDGPINHPHAQDPHRLIHLQIQEAEDDESDDEDERLLKAQAKAAKDAEKAAEKAAKDAEKAANLAAKKAAKKAAKESA